MNHKLFGAACLGAVSILLAGCSNTTVKADPKAEAPPPPQVISANADTFSVEKPAQFPLVTAGEYSAAPQLNATGTVTPDVSRNVPVISVASGRVLEVHARLGDNVTKGQLLMKVQSADISAAFSEYRQAMADQTLAHAQLSRAKLLLDKGAIAQKDYEIAVDAADKADVTVETAQEHLRVLGADKDHPSAIIDVTAPVSGVITDQQVTQAAGVAGIGSPNPFTISDLSHVWILCDVYENDLRNVHMGDRAEVRLNAYPDRVFSARVGNIGASLDPNLRSAKVRLELENPVGIMRFGMFVTATFFGAEKQKYVTVPSSAILHLHDADWVYTAAPGGFRRVEVKGGQMLPGNQQEVLSGITPGTQVVANALILQNSAEQ